MMRITLAKSAGFCFGVRRALAIALETIDSGSKVYMLGDIVHNETITKRLQKAGAKKIKRLACAKSRTLLIRAHGTGKNIIKDAKRLGYKIIDATCPMVKEIHKKATEIEKKGYRIIIIGDKKHDEVKGIMGQLNHKALVIGPCKRFPLKTAQRIKKGAVVVQSTQDIEKVLTIVDKLRSHIQKLKFFNTICNPTRKKQEEIKKLSLENDIVIIIGSKTSANTKRLYEISKSLNKRSFWIQSKGNLKKKWFRNAKTVGITAGASTPPSTTKDIMTLLQNSHHCFLVRNKKCYFAIAP